MIRLAGGVPVELPTTDATGFQRHPRPARGGGHATDQDARSSCRLPTRPARYIRGTRWRRSAAGPSTGASGWSPTRSTSTSSTATPSLLDAGPGAGASGPLLVVNGVAKTYAMTGWRVGWMIGPAHMIKGAASLQSHATSNVSNVAQVAALAAVSGDLVGGRRDARRRSIAGASRCTRC